MFKFLSFSLLLLHYLKTVDSGGESFSMESSSSFLTSSMDSSADFSQPSDGQSDLKADLARLDEIRQEVLTNEKNLTISVLATIESDKEVIDIFAEVPKIRQLLQEILDILEIIELSGRTSTRPKRQSEILNIRLSCDGLNQVLVNLGAAKKNLKSKITEAQNNINAIEDKTKSLEVQIQSLGGQLSNDQVNQLRLELFAISQQLKTVRSSYKKQLKAISTAKRDAKVKRDISCSSSNESGEELLRTLIPLNRLGIL